MERWWGSTDSTEFLSQLSVVLKILERLIQGYAKEDKEIVKKVNEFAGKKHGKSKLELVPLRSELGKKQSISVTELEWIKKQKVVILFLQLQWESIPSSIAAIKLPRNYILPETCIPFWKNSFWQSWFFSWQHYFRSGM